MKYEYIKQYVLTAGGGTNNIPVTDSNTLYVITGSTTLLGSWIFQPTGTPYDGARYDFELDCTITQNGHNVTIFGSNLTATQLVTPCKISCVYYGSAWNLFITEGDSFAGSGIGGRRDWSYEKRTITTTGGTFTLDPTLDSRWIDISGTATLTSSLTVSGGGTPKDGDTFFLDYTANLTTGVNTVTLFGVTLTETQALNGNMFVIAIYDEGTTTWKAKTFQQLDASTPAIETTMIVDSAVTTIKIANDAVDKTKIAADVAGDGLSQAVGGELDVLADPAGSLSVSATGVKLTGDLLAPGNNKYWGTNSAGVKSWYDLTVATYVADTRANIITRMTAGTLNPGNLYYITDRNVFATAVSTTQFSNRCDYAYYLGNRPFGTIVGTNLTVPITVSQAKVGVTNLMVNPITMAAYSIANLNTFLLNVVTEINNNTSAGLTHGYRAFHGTNSDSGIIVIQNTQRKVETLALTITATAGTWAGGNMTAGANTLTNPIIYDFNYDILTDSVQYVKDTIYNNKISFTGLTPLSYIDFLNYDFPFNKSNVFNNTIENCSVFDFVCIKNSYHMYGNVIANSGISSICLNSGNFNSNIINYSTLYRIILYGGDIANTEIYSTTLSVPICECNITETRLDNQIMNSWLTNGDFRCYSTSNTRTYYIEKLFDGTAGNGTTGDINLPELVQLETGEFISEAIYVVETTLDVASAPTLRFGIFTDDVAAAGLETAANLNAAIITKYTNKADITLTRATAQRAFVGDVASGPIAFGQLNIKLVVESVENN